MSQQQCHNNSVATTVSQQPCHNNSVTTTVSQQQCHNNRVTTTVSQQPCHNSKLVIFQEKRLTVLKCYTFVWVQRRQNCSPAASFTNCAMTLYLLRVHLQTFLSIPITQKCQISSCGTLVANELYEVALCQDIRSSGTIHFSNPLLLYRKKMCCKPGKGI